MNKSNEYRLMLDKVRREISTIVDIQSSNIPSMGTKNIMEWLVVVSAILIGLRLSLWE